MSDGDIVPYGQHSLDKEKSVQQLADGELLLKVGGAHPIAKEWYRTLDLLKLDGGTESPIYLVVEDSAEFESPDEIRANKKYFYEEHQCPTNITVGSHIQAWVFEGDIDCHGLFHFVDFVWLTDKYEDDNDGFILKAFPQLTEGTV
jgi:hypothetical protein